MKNILLIEPDYYSKYPPLGLMKIAYYHKEKRNDTVWFSKGKLPAKVSEIVKKKMEQSKYYQENYGEQLYNHINKIDEIIKNKKWDRIYISTLFTYEWAKTIEIINYAKELVDNVDKIYVGGILATLMKEDLFKATGVNVIDGQLTNPSKIDILDDDENIDIITPDYSILENTEYEYPASDAYYTYTTRGCGMNCDFCAVKILEPNFEPFISIKEQIETIDKKFGLKKDLLLMDNNVLKSPKFNSIIREIKDIGFAKGAQQINPRTGKLRNRYVDFNQGLDAFLFTEEKSSMLSEIAIRPARIAFDHIEDSGAYVKAVELAVKNNITHISNYLLYNGQDFTGKGREYKADTPENLYDRLKLNVELRERFNKKRKEEGKEMIHIFSFPMRYRPLDHKTRGNIVANDGSTENVDFVGPNWNVKYLRAIQRMLLPTQGKGVSSKSFFKAAFGKTRDIFMETILMPEDYIATRGEPNKIRGISDKERIIKIKEFETWENIRLEWKRLYYQLNSSEKQYFINLIGDNQFNIDKIVNNENNIIRKLLIHYFSNSGTLLLLEELEIEMEDEVRNQVINYITHEFPLMLEKLSKYIIDSNINGKPISLYFKYFKEQGADKLLGYWISHDFEEDRVITVFDKANYLDSDIFYLYMTKWALKFDLLETNEISELKIAFKQKNKEKLNDILSKKYLTIFKKLEDVDLKLANEIKDDLSTQISLFDVL